MNRRTGLKLVLTLSLLALFTLAALSPALPVVHALGGPNVDESCHGTFGAGHSVSCNIPTLNSRDNLITATFEGYFLAGSGTCISPRLNASSTSVTWTHGGTSCSNLGGSPDSNVWVATFYAQPSGLSQGSYTVTVTWISTFGEAIADMQAVAYYNMPGSFSTNSSADMTTGTCNPCTSAVDTVSPFVQGVSFLTLSANFGDPQSSVTSPVGFNQYALGAGSGQTWMQYNNASFTGPTTLPTTVGRSGSGVLYYQETGLTFYSSSVTQPVKMSPVVGTTQQTVTITSCSPSPSSFTGDTSVHNIMVSGSCTSTYALPGGYLFTSNGMVSRTIHSCPTGTCTELDDTYYSTAGAKVGITFETSPLNLPNGLVIGGNAYATNPVTLRLLVGANISISSPASVTKIPDTYTWVSWSDSGTRTHYITIPSSPATYISYFKVSPASCGSSNPLIMLENNCIIPAVIDAWTAPIGPGPWFSFVLLGVNVAVYNKTQSVWVGMVVLLVTGGVFSLFLPAYVGQIANIFLALGAAGLVVKAVLLLR